jgi:hypothetical protein
VGGISHDRDDRCATSRQGFGLRVEPALRTESKAWRGRDARLAVVIATGLGVIRSLTAGSRRLVVEYYEDAGGAVAHAAIASV